MEILAVFPPLFASIIAGLFGRVIGDRAAQLVTVAGVVIAATCRVDLRSASEFTKRQNHRVLQKSFLGKVLDQSCVGSVKVRSHLVAKAFDGCKWS